jgi:1-acyl-sn-glycerol-3-phosphate acyltransferase
MIYRLIRFLNRVFLRMVIRLEVIGEEKAPESGAFIAAANHLGVLDPLLVYYLLDREDIIIMVAEYHSNYAFRRWLVRTVGAIFVDRYKADYAVLREVLERLKNGEVLVIAPEGTRSKSGGLQPGQAGAAYLGAKTGFPILPVAVFGTEDRQIFANLKRLRRTRVTVRAGDLFTLQPLPRENRENIIQEYTDEIMCRIAALLPEEYRGVYSDHPMVREFQD